MKLKFKLFFLLLIISIGCQLKAQTNSYQKMMAEIQLIQKELVPDKRVGIFDIQMDSLQTPLAISGKTNLPEAILRIAELFDAKGLAFTNSIQLLPAKELGEKTWALVTLSVAGMRAKPDHAAELLTQAIMGTPLKVYEQEDGWYRVQSPDGYLGWMEGNGLENLHEKELNHWKSSKRLVFTNLQGNAFEIPDLQSLPMTDLLLGNIFEMIEENNGFYKIKLPDGRMGFVSSSDCMIWESWINQKPNAKKAILVARFLLGVPYLWGGTSTKGMDCSGMTKTAWFSQGVILARDASQQVRYGDHPDFKNIAALQSGDLLFFGRNAQRVTHVGLYMGKGEYIHASGRVRINSIDPDDERYNLTESRSLVGSSRILSALNTEGITLVKDHSWYNK
jgi:SH3-like domain-containing protein